LTDDQASASGSPRRKLASRTHKDGAIYLFQRADYKKQTWFCRVKVPKTKGYTYRSTGTSNEFEAYRFAEDLYNQLLVDRLTGGERVRRRLGGLLVKYLDEQRISATKASVKNRILLFERLKPILNSIDVSEIDTAKITELLMKVESQSAKKRLSPNTLIRISSDLRHFLNWLVEQGEMKAVPKFPRLLSERSNRPHFDRPDWRKLTSKMRSFTKSENEAVRRQRIMLVNYVLFMANTGLRTGEARLLRWRDISLSTDPDTNVEHIVCMVSGKTGIRDVVARTPDVRKYLARIRELRIKETEYTDGQLREVDLNSFVFCHPDGKAIASFKKSFQSLLKFAGVEFDTFGRKRTVYSLRHTYATFRLEEGVNHFLLARNMGTSVGMLERFYGQTSNIASLDELTKSSGKRRVPSSKSLSWLSKA